MIPLVLLLPASLAEAADPPPDTPARRIVLAIGKEIRSIDEEAGGGRVRPAADDRADRLVRSAFRAARTEVDRGTEPATAARALLVALGASLDRSGLLAKNPMARALVGRLESPAEERTRAADLGSPSLRGRPDSFQHFVVSAALAAVFAQAGVPAGRAAAWSAGLEKETLDATGKDKGNGSGFSFADLAADAAGIEFACLVLSRAAVRDDFLKFLDSQEAGFRGKDFAPDFGPYEKDPDEGLGWKAFGARFGSISDPRFEARVKAIRDDVLACPAFAPAGRRP